MSKLVSAMSTPEEWDDIDNLINFLARKLVQKRLSLFLGAGASHAFNLPNWTQLVDNLYEMASMARPTPKDDVRDAESLFLNKYKSDRIAFAKAVQLALYKNYSHQQSALEANPLLSSIGAMVMSSARGRVAHVITLNYDDILESYLKWRGFTVSSVAKLPAWNSDSDVEVLHPHGLLSLDTSQNPASGIVLTQLDYDDIVGNVKDLWRQRIIGTLRSTTCVFLGLSGKDDNLTSILKEVNGSHPSSGVEPYWGVRFDCDNNENIWLARGVYVHKPASHSETPELLMKICQRAAAIRNGIY